MCDNPCDYLARTLSDEVRDTVDPRVPIVVKPAGTAESDASKLSGTIGSASELPRRTARLVLDESTHILQVVVREADTDTVLAKFPDDRWLEAVRLMRAYEAAIVDCKA